MLSQRTMRKTVQITVVLLLLAGVAAAQDEGDGAGESTGRATSADMELTFTGENSANLVVTQEWSGEDAQAFRSIMDRLGNADGELDESEVNKVLEAARTDLSGARHPDLTVDGVPAQLQTANVTAEGLAGGVNDTTSFTVRHEVDLAFDLNNTGTAHQFEFMPFADGQLTIRAPAGWQLTGVTGVTGVSDAPAQEVRGEVTQGNAVTATLEGAPEEAGGEGAAGGTPIPTGGILAVLAAAAVAAMTGTRRARGRGGA